MAQHLVELVLIWKSFVRASLPLPDTRCVLEMLENIEIPEEVTQIEEAIKEQTGIPGFPVEAILVGAAAIGLALRKRD